MKPDKWEWLGIIAMIFNPVPTGIIAGYFLHRDRYATGKYIMLVSVMWFAAMMYLTMM